ncbi:MAG: TlpA family protein disulfide reductase, partial [Actinomycetota bacterium]|nr:TlpA family protein disulfide reductase [Actinomycetota bacterium]
ALHAQRNQLLGGGAGAFKARLSKLQGAPVVVNVWASWCSPCRAEFPLFQVASTRLGRRVAFLGVDTLDAASDARAFLGKFPVAYPSYEDSSGAIARSLAPTQGVPITVFLDRSGRVTYFHQGPYRTEGALISDIRRYAQGT